MEAALDDKKSPSLSSFRDQPLLESAPSNREQNDKIGEIEQNPMKIKGFDMLFSQKEGDQISSI